MGALCLPLAQACLVDRLAMQTACFSLSAMGTQLCPQSLTRAPHRPCAYPCTDSLQCREVSQAPDISHKCPAARSHRRWWGGMWLLQSKGADSHGEMDAWMLVACRTCCVHV